MDFMEKARKLEWAADLIAGVSWIHALTLGASHRLERETNFPFLKWVPVSSTNRAAVVAPKNDVSKEDHANFADILRRVAPGARKALNKFWFPVLGQNQKADLVRHILALCKDKNEHNAIEMLQEIAFKSDNAARNSFAAGSGLMKPSESDYESVHILAEWEDHLVDARDYLENRRNRSRKGKGWLHSIAG